jgi:hypothetical protein
LGFENTPLKSPARLSKPFSFATLVAILVAILRAVGGNVRNNDAAVDEAVDRWETDEWCEREETIDSAELFCEKRFVS